MDDIETDGTSQPSHRNDRLEQRSPSLNQVSLTRVRLSARHVEGPAGAESVSVWTRRRYPPRNVGLTGTPEYFTSEGCHPRAAFCYSSRGAHDYEPESQRTR